MIQIDKTFLITEYNYYKHKGLKYLNDNLIEESLISLKYAAFIAWNYPILYNFIDDEVENALDEISDILNKNKGVVFQGNENKIVFYSGQIIDYGGLTQQYLYFLVENGYQILFIIPDIKATKEGSEILDYLNKNNNIELFIPKSSKLSVKIKEINSRIDIFKPSKAFLHFMPHDVEGYCVFTKLNIPRYFIVHNDHTFWLGKGCSDYFIEFRKFGCQLSMQRRHMRSDKIIYLPYYPIEHIQKFQGFPFDRKNKIIGVSGANLYKYYLDKELNFFHAIKELIIRNENFIFCLAGFGDATIVKNFISQNNLQNRFYYVGKRNDFNEFIGNCDIFFESYPLKGGLTFLYASKQNIPILGLSNHKNASGGLEDWIETGNYKQPNNFENFIIQADLLIKNKDLRDKNAIIFSNNLFNRKDFTNNLKQLLEGHKEFLSCKFPGLLQLDDNYYLNEFISVTGSSLNYFYFKFYYIRNISDIFERFREFCSIIRLNYTVLKLKQLIRLIMILIFKK